MTREIRSAFAECRTVLDVGCGNSSPLRFLSALHVTGIDGYPPAVEEARRAGTHDEYVVGNVLQIKELFGGRRFDACAGLDVIEHLQKEDGWRMLEQMESLATKRVIIFTPNGFVPQRSQHGDLQEHLSGWTAGEFRSKGYRVIGMCGLKSLRGEYHALKYRPRALWALISVLSHYLLGKKNPERSAALFCNKTLDAQAAKPS